jgi:transposase InsO family protein
LIDESRASHEFAGTYGSPRVWLELRRRGVRVSRKRVERIMQENDRRGAYLRKGWKGGSTKQNPRHIAAPDLLDRDFTATAPNRKWVADLTRIPTGEGVLWLASVRDAFSNKVVGWAVRAACGHRPGALRARLRPVLPRRPWRRTNFPQRQGLPINGAAVHAAARGRRHRPVHRQCRGQLR